MHVEVPKAKTFKEFGGEYLMIVISILTALGLEAVFERVHHRHLAHEARERMDTELRANLKDIKQVLAHNEQKEKALVDIREQMAAALRAHVSNDDFVKRFKRDWATSIGMSLHSPSLRREAWETAVANQAVTWIPATTLEKYAVTYANVRDMNAMLNGGGMNFLDGPRMHDVFSDVQTDAGNARDLFHIVTQMISAYDSVDGNLKLLQQELEVAVADLEKS